MELKGAWNRRFGLLYIDQPVGVGFSPATEAHPIPHSELPVAADLFNALNNFYEKFKAYKKRPLFITGEVRGGSGQPLPLQCRG
jgi:vitellogenic carboxypeptidase-like protein